MGACYFVKLKVKVLDEQSAIKVLNEYIKRSSHRIRFNLEEYAKRNITTETFDDLMRIFLADHTYDKVEITQKRIYTYYQNDFNASYGWESVMMDMFDVIAPYVQDNSELLIYPDTDYDKLVVRNGKCIQLH